jgi:hypothetical protein
MDVITLNGVLDNFTARQTPYHLWEEPNEIAMDARIQDTAAIFGYPHNMKLGSICTMA